MANVNIQNLNKSFGPVEVLKNIDLSVEDGSFVVLVGPSGCGKSTLLRCVAGLEPIGGGTISIAGKTVNDLPPAKREIAMVFQSYALYPHMNVERNMGFGLRFTGHDKAEINKRVAEASRILQLQDLMHRKPRELSGGQRQRVAIGRAIVRKPQVFLFDEPLSNLDAALRVNTRLELARLHKLLKATIIYVTHDQVEAMTLADKIVVMNQGRIEQAGKPLDLYYKPANKFVAGFIGSPAMNMFDVTINARKQAVLPDGNALTLALPKSCKSGSKITLGIRPEHLALQKLKAGATLSGKLELIERLGEMGYAHLDVASGLRLVVEVRGEPPVGKGGDVHLKIDPKHLHCFGSDGQALQ
jgi:ABC-type sugar transport system ATPase subunit